MKSIKQLKKQLDKLGDNSWRKRCALDTGYTYQTVINVINGKHPNIHIMRWMNSEIANTKHMFI